MKTKLKWLIHVVCLCLIVGGALFFRNNKEIIPTEVKTIQKDYIIDVSDPRKVIGHADYTFVAKVVATRDFYQSKAKDFPESIVANDLPVTECTIEVIYNIKGELIENTPIKFYKDGGISQDGKYLILCENDSLPQIGKYYIITACAQKDGRLTVSGAFACVLLEEDFSPDNIKDSKLIAKYEDAYKNEIIEYRKAEDRCIATYDVKNEDSITTADSGSPSFNSSDSITTTAPLETAYIFN